MFAFLKIQNYQKIKKVDYKYILLYCFKIYKYKSKELLSRTFKIFRNNVDKVSKANCNENTNDYILSKY